MRKQGLAQADATRLLLCCAHAGETANGQHPPLVVSTMADIVSRSELGISYHEQFHSIRCAVHPSLPRLC